MGYVFLVLLQLSRVLAQRRPLAILKTSESITSNEDVSPDVCVRNSIQVYINGLVYSFIHFSWKFKENHWLEISTWKDAQQLLSENGNQNHGEILYIHLDGYNADKITATEVVKQLEPLTLLMRMYSGTTCLEKQSAIPQMLTIGLPYDPAVPSLGKYIQKNFLVNFIFNWRIQTKVI